MENQENKKSKLKIILIIAIIVILLGIVGIFSYVRVLEDNCTGNTTNVNSNGEENNTINVNYNKSAWDQLTEIHPDIHKPIIYLYPQETTELSLRLGKPEKIT